MDLEMDGADYTGHAPLKRYNSAPYINIPGVELRTSCESPTSSAEPSPRLNDSGSTMGIQIADRMSRRFSTSSVALLHSPTGLTKAPSRIDQIRLEESVAQRDREAAHEREMQSKMVMTQNWDDLSLSKKFYELHALPDANLSLSCRVCKEDTDPDAMVTEIRRPRSFTEPLHVITSVECLSPTRNVGKQCFSPSLQQSIRTSSFTPSPSPTRKAYVRRSLSPIVLRPSPLSAVKRRIESESVDLTENYFSTPKRHRSSNSPTACTSSTDIYQLRASSCSVSCGSSTDDDPETASSADAINSKSSPAPMTSVATSHPSMMMSSFMFRHIARDTFQTSPVESTSASSSSLESRCAVFDPRISVGDTSGHVDSTVMDSQSSLGDSNQVEMDSQPTLLKSNDTEIGSRVLSDVPAGLSVDEIASDICDCLTA